MFLMSAGLRENNSQKLLFLLPFLLLHFILVRLHPAAAKHV